MKKKTANIEYTLNVVMAFCEKNAVTSIDRVVKLIYDVYDMVSHMKSSMSRYAPVVSVEDSVCDEYIICLEDGKRLKTLKRHLMTEYHMTPEEYRRKWNLPANYPMVASSYSKLRSDLARASGLGHGQFHESAPAKAKGK